MAKQIKKARAGFERRIGMTWVLSLLHANEQSTEKVGLTAILGLINHNYNPY